MIRHIFRRIISRPITLLPLLLNVVIFFPQTAKAEDYTVTGAQDFYIVLDSPQEFSVRAYAWQYGIDSMLWLHDSTDALLAENDDYFGLDSYLSLTLQPGTYRLRTGVCCGDPNRWYGSSYVIVTSFAVATTTTMQETTTSSVQETTTTQEPTTTTEASTTTTIPPTTEIPTTIPEVIPEETTTSTGSFPTSTVQEPATTELQQPPTSLTQPDVPETVAPTTELPVATTTSTTTIQLPPPLTSTSSTSTSTTTTQPVVVTPTTTTTSIDPPEPIKDQPVPPTVAPPIPAVEELSAFPPEELKQVFETLDVSVLTDEEKEELSAQLSAAPDDVKAAFEEAVNIFSGDFETYVPKGSAINVGQRKVIVAATSVLFVAPTIPTSPPPASNTGPSGGSGGGPSGSNTSSESGEKRQGRRGRK